MEYISKKKFKLKTELRVENSKIAGFCLLLAPVAATENVTEPQGANWWGACAQCWCVRMCTVVWFQNSFEALRATIDSMRCCFFLPSSSTLLYSAEWIGVPTYNSFLFYLNLFFCVQGLRMERDTELLKLNVYLILGSSWDSLWFQSAREI